MLFIKQLFIGIHPFVGIVKCDSDIYRVRFICGTDSKHQPVVFFRYLTERFDFALKIIFGQTGKNNDKFVTAGTENVLFIKHFP